MDFAEKFGNELADLEGKGTIENIVVRMGDNDLGLRQEILGVIGLLMMVRLDVENQQKKPHQKISIDIKHDPSVAERTVIAWNNKFPNTPKKPRYYQRLGLHFEVSRDVAVSPLLNIGNNSKRFEI